MSILFTYTCYTHQFRTTSRITDDQAKLKVFAQSLSLKLMSFFIGKIKKLLKLCLKKGKLKTFTVVKDVLAKMSFVSAVYFARATWCEKKCRKTKTTDELHWISVK